MKQYRYEASHDQIQSQQYQEQTPSLKAGLPFGIQSSPADLTLTQPAGFECVRTTQCQQCQFSQVPTAERSQSQPTVQFPSPFQSEYESAKESVEATKSQEFQPRNLSNDKSNSYCSDSSGPYFGSKSEQGFRMYQEDRCAEKLGLYQIRKCQCTPRQRIPDGLLKYPALQKERSLDSYELSREKELSSLHYFAVFDGHGGDLTSKFCQEKMADILEERLQHNLSSAYSIASVELGQEHKGQLVQDYEMVMQDDIDVDGDGTCVGNCRQFIKNTSNKTSSSDSDSTESGDCTDEIEKSLRETFLKTDQMYQEQGGENQDVIGSTAVVALVSSDSIYVANVGDSRAVLCRNGEAIPLSDDHKADRWDELERVKGLGGHVLHWNGVRVMGVLAMSRAIGDAQLKPYIIAEPEVTVVHRKKSDQLIILASDGLWDVFDNQEACMLALRCLYRAKQRGATRRSATKIAAAILAKAAIDRGSRDNVTVLVVDLKAKDQDFTREEVQEAVRIFKENKQQEEDDILANNHNNNDDMDMDTVKIIPQGDSVEQGGSAGERIPPSPFVTPAVQVAQHV
eukprot:TRINITY_DN2203_c1_g2_i1.p2 TRINITY_DN2203_c1_g2~~TRINITY_DN2203_c1_g2_i1.p2  ORF type:complete len:569 (+),score=92.23 TRINITY_DN2203_c1_g2_i1:283-1989(+)